MSRNQNRRGGAKRNRADEWSADSRDLSTLHNDAFETYYRGNVVQEGEWETFMSCLRTSLPMAVRVNVALPCAERVREFLLSHLTPVFDTKILPFFPREMGIQCGVGRGDLKRNAAHRYIKKAIAALNEGGYLTRQETVSMLPPLLLQVEPGHRVLDLCAAPGSKTSQILEALLPSPNMGVVVANDMNASRLDVLHHQTNRSPGAHRHLIITNYDAMRFPIVASADKFDRVLCDVMCSGDGTLRKSLDMWPRWNPLQGADLHLSQSRVLLRGMASCKVGGRVVYSTCSLNPIEDEAVVSACLEASKGAFRLIDAGPLLPGLQGQQGLTRWTLTTKDGSAKLTTFAEAEAYMSQQKGKCFQYRATMFANPELLEQQKISYTRRVLPHTQDTGGFYVAVLECVAEMTDSPTVLDRPADAPPLEPLVEELKPVVRAALNLPDEVSMNGFVSRRESSREPKIYCANPVAIQLSSKLGGRLISVGGKVIESYVKHSHDKLRFAADGIATLVPLLPSSMIASVSPTDLLSIPADGGLSFAEMATLLHCDEAALPQFPSFVLRCEVRLVGVFDVAVERSTKHGKYLIKICEWHRTLCKIHLGLPIVEEPVDLTDAPAAAAATPATSA